MSVDSAVGTRLCGCLRYGSNQTLRPPANIGQHNYTRDALWGVGVVGIYQS